MDEIEEMLLEQIRACHKAAMAAYGAQAEAVGAAADRQGRLASSFSRGTAQLTEALRLHRNGGQSTQLIVYRLEGFAPAARRKMIMRIATHVDGGRIDDDGRLIHGDVQPILRRPASELEGIEKP
jgi:hypothetical protein